MRGTGGPPAAGSSLAEFACGLPAVRRRAAAAGAAFAAKPARRTAQGRRTFPLRLLHLVWQSHPRAAVSLIVWVRGGRNGGVAESPDSDRDELWCCVQNHTVEPQRWQKRKSSTASAPPIRRQTGLTLHPTPRPRPAAGVPAGVATVTDRHAERLSRLQREAARGEHVAVFVSADWLRPGEVSSYTHPSEPAARATLGGAAGAARVIRGRCMVMRAQDVWHIVM